MHGMEKSDSVVVAAKSANKGTRVSAEPVERRTEPEGNPEAKARAGRSAGKACHLRPTGYGDSYAGSHGSV